MVIGFDASRAFVTQPTGTENYSYQLLKALSKIDKKNQYRVYVKNFQFPISNFQFPTNFRFIKIPLSRLWTQVGLAWECLLNPPDILFIPAHTLPIIRRPNLKTVVTVHDLGAEFLPQYHTFPRRFHLMWSTKYAVKNAKAIIAVSGATKKDLVEKLGTVPDRIFVVYEGVDRSKFKVQSSKFKVGEILKKYKIQKPYILFVGTVQPRKNLVRLIEAFSHLILNTKYYIHNFQLVIAGKLGWLYDEILAAPKKYKVENKVKFLGFVPQEELPTIYSQAEVFVLPAQVEGFGLPVLEAMAAGIPVVLSNYSSLPEVAGEAALYFNPENIMEMTNTIFRVLTNAKLREELIQKGRRQIEQFSWEKCAKETLKVLARVQNEN